MQKTIYLAGGCFWGVEKYIALIDGVTDTETGYANGNTENPSYEDVCHRNSGHAETVRVEYDSEKLPLANLLRVFLKVIDPTSLNQQGADCGTQYRCGIYFTDAADLPIIQSIMHEAAGQYDQPLVLEVLPLNNFYPAEEYHQNYLQKNPNGYCHIHFD